MRALETVVGDKTKLETLETTQRLKAFSLRARSYNVRRSFKRFFFCRKRNRKIGQNQDLLSVLAFGKKTEPQDLSVEIKRLL